MAEKLLTRLAPSLLVVLLAAKAMALAGHDLPRSWWSPIAFFWHDALVVLAFATVALVVPVAASAAVIAIYFAIASYVALNVPVTRVLSTPLTWPMWRAARGPLADSMLMYATRDNIAPTVAVIALAVGSPFVLARGVRVCAIVLVSVVALGPLAASRVDTRGFERNAWTALVTTMPLLTRERTSIEPERTWFEQERTSIGPERTTVERERPWPRFGFAAGRNVVMISLESTGAQYLGLYGAAPDVMPNLTALARHGIVFEHAYAVYPESIKGLFSVLCSAYPPFDRPAESLAAAPCLSIADLLGRRGYRTALFHSGRFGYLGMASIVRNRGYDVLEDAGDVGGQHESSFGVDEQATVSRMLRWIDALDPNDRFFLTYLPIAGHHPYDTPAPGPFAEHDTIDRYRNALAYGDAALGSLIEGLRARGLENRTLWVVFGDHGEAFGQHDGNYGHTFQIFDENVHVPFVVSAPGLIPGQVRSDRIVSLIDAAPTILDALGGTPPPVYQGRSMFDGSRRAAVFFTDYSLKLVGIRDDRFKTIYELDSGRVRLFDMANDPRETTDIAHEDPEQTALERRIVSRR